MRTIEQAASVMGMTAHREVLEVREGPEGDMVLTHDGRWTLIRPDGSMALTVDAPPEMPEAVVPADAPVAVKKTGRKS